MTMAIEKCDLCIANGGRFQAKNYCCRIRKLADAPKQLRKALYEQLKVSDGVESVNQIIADVNAELQTRRGENKGGRK
jgi:hypothetical protein